VEEEYEILLIFEWRQEARIVQNSLLVGPLAVTRVKDCWLRAGNSLYVVCKDLALPLALVALTFLFSQLANDAADRHHERERFTEQVRETLARMLVVNRRDAQRFYLPLLAAASLLVARLRDRRHNWRREAFFHLMTFLRVMQRIKDENGGLFLKSRKGENVIASVWWIFKPAAEDRFTPKRYAAALDEIGTKESYSRFLAKLPERPALQHCWATFESWLEPAGTEEIPFSEYLPIVQILCAALSYEIDRPLIYWYEEADKPPREELEKGRNQLLNGRLACEAADAKVAAKIEEYLEELDIEVPRFNARMRRIRGEG
jgi:hypothetical protein